ncbi:MAG: penicillin-binding protein 1A [Candidatus Symbiobacter sp.]|nr:penicillin-binding protein 1A [Candidatus Symbiobacter sp.]
MKKWLIFGSVVIGLGAALLIGMIVTVVIYFSKSLPATYTLTNYQPSVVTRIHAGDGRLIAEFASEKRVFVPISSIPKRVIWTFIAAEDKDFYQHSGIDPRGIARATLSNIFNIFSNRRPEGGSTITQQVAKNFLLSNEISFTRKIKEILLALRIEKNMTKDHILELYLNEIYLGGGSYGVAAAAIWYFNHSLEQLTIGETAFLAALPKAPNNYNPTLYPDRALERRNWVIGRMVEQGLITNDEANKAYAEPLVIREKSPGESVQAEYFAEEVRRELVQRYGESVLYKGGLTARTSLDPRLQQIADRVFHNALVAYDMRHNYRGPFARGSAGNLVERLINLPSLPILPSWDVAGVSRVDAKGVDLLVKRGLQTPIIGRMNWENMEWAKNSQIQNDENGDSNIVPKFSKATDVFRPGDLIYVEKLDGKAGQYSLRQIPEITGGMLALDPHTGRVLALVGGWSFDLSEFDRAVQAFRQPGSSFKPFVYMAALDNGMTPSTIVLDAPFVQDMPDGSKWNPANFGEKFIGPAPMRLGIEQSRNLMTVRIAQAIGMDKVAEYAEKFGVVDRMKPELAIAIGAADTTLMRMVTAYGMIVNGGKKITPSLIDRVQDHTGRTIYKADTRPCPGCNQLNQFGTPPEIPDVRKQIVEPTTAYQMVSMMQSVVTRGTGAAIGAALRRPLAGKTGTTNDFTDAWFVGFSPDLVVGVYFGFDKPTSLGNLESGSRLAVPVFRDFMAEALKNTPPIPFRIPTGIKLVRINPETGALADGSGKSIYEAYKSGTEPRPGDNNNVGGGGGDKGDVGSGLY